MTKLFFFLQTIRSFITVSELERRANLPQNALQKHYAFVDGKEGRPLPAHHAAAIFIAICKVFTSVEIDGYIVRAEPGMFFLYKQLKEREESVEVNDEAGGSYFEYKCVEVRSLLDTFEFNAWMQENISPEKQDHNELEENH